MVQLVKLAPKRYEDYGNAEDVPVLHSIKCFTLTTCILPFICLFSEWLWFLLIHWSTWKEESSVFIPTKGNLDAFTRSLSSSFVVNHRLRSKLFLLNDGIGRWMYGFVLICYVPYPTRIDGLILRCEVMHIPSRLQFRLRVEIFICQVLPTYICW